MSTTPDDLRERLRLYATTARQEGDATIECRTNDLLALLADRDRLQAENERLRNEVEAWHDASDENARLLSRIADERDQLREAMRDIIAVEAARHPDTMSPTEIAREALGGDDG